LRNQPEVTVRRRVHGVFWFLGLVLSLLALRLAWVQLVRGEELYQKALDNRMRDVVVEAKRGVIYDRNGKELALSISSDAIYAVPPEVVQSGRAREIAETLGRILEMDADAVFEKITRNSRHEWIKLKVPPEKAAEIKKLHLPGIDFAEKSQRFYPKGSLACHVLGIAGIDNKGLEGIDYTYEQELGGTAGRIMIEYDALGRKIPQAMHMYIPPQNGNSVVLTIDETVQYIAERELDKLYSLHQPKSATIIVMDPNTGEVLALACRPNFDPNNYAAFPAANRRNIAVSNAYEPGSIFKIVTASAGLEEGVVTPDSTFYCGGSLQVGKHTIHCSGNRAHGSQTLRDITANSCNVGYATLGLRLGLERFYQYLQAFGIGSKTGIDLPGEASGIIVSPQRATQVDLATMSIGQANALTPIQLITALSAVANGGNYVRPHLVKAVVSPDGQTIKEFAPEIVRRVISPRTSEEMRSILEEVVANGTGKNAAVDGYRVAGKTGTAQKPSPGGGYMKDEYVASFMGFAPADNPRIAVLVLVDGPQSRPYFGGWVAAPAFKEVVRDVLRYLDVPYQYPPHSEQSRSQEMTAAGLPAKEVPPTIGLSAAEAEALLKKTGFVPVIEGEGEKVWGQSPPAQTLAAPGSRVVLYTGPREAKSEGGEEITVPDLTGKTIREAGYILGTLGLRLQANGSGVAVKQDHLPGTVVKKGTLITVDFLPRHDSS